MVLEVVWSPYGRAAATALHEAVARAKGGEPLAPVTVVVPSNHVGVASRRLLASGVLGPVAGSGVGLAAVTFLTTYRLAELLGAPLLAGTGRRPVSTPVLAAAMRAELDADAGLFEPVKQHPATESALVSTYRELRDLSDAALDALAGTSERAREVVRLHRAAHRRLQADWYDEEDLLDAAATMAASPVAGELGAVVMQLPQRLSQHSARLVKALAEHVPTTVIAGVTGIPEADHEVLRSAERLGIDASTAVGIGDPAPVAPHRTTILSASDSDEEVRAAIRAVVDAARSGTRLDRMAVLHASADPYARLAHEQLHAAGVATNGAAVVPLSARVAGRTLLDLLALPEHDFRRQDVLALVTAAPVLHKGRWAPTTAWERISREAGVVAGRADWDAHLASLAATKQTEAARAADDPEEPAWVAERARGTAERAGELRTFVLRVIDDLTAAASAPRRWSEHATWAQGWLNELLGRAARRDSWPEHERKAAERVEVAIARLGALDDVEGPVDLDIFTRTLTIELDADLGRVGRFGDGVLVGSVEMGIGLDLDLVVILGLAEGSFPTTVRDDSLLPDGERARAAGELAPRADAVGRQQRQLLGSLAGAERQLLCRPRGDLRRSVERVPSRWVVELAAALAGVDRWMGDLATTHEPWAENVPSFDAGIRDVPVPATPQEHRLRALLAGGGRLSSIDDAATLAGAEVVSARKSDRFTRFDGNLSGLDVPSPIDNTTSPTRLERWAGCPHQHLVQDLLKAPPIENPEDDLTISALEKGSLVHLCLETFLREVLDRPDADRPGPTDPWTDADRARMQEIGARCCDDAEAAGVTGRPIFWKRDRRWILADLDRFLTLDSAHRATFGLRPVAVELGFGFADGIEAVPVTLPDGRVLHVRGRADRLDRADDGTLHVVDYKTGSSGWTKVSQEDPIAAGTKLQLPLYGLAGRLHQGEPHAAVVAEYWFVTRKGEFKRKGYPVTDDVLERTISTLDEIVTGIEAGRFPPHPDRDSSRPGRFVRCEVCDPDRLGTVDLRKQFERKRHDPELAPYANLAEPLDDVDEEVPA